MLNFLKKKNESKITINAIASGKLLPLEQVNDPVFSNKMMGDGVAVYIDDEYILSPTDGTISLIADTKHAFGITTAEGIEIMVHVGLETVNLKGQGFEKHKEIGDQVKKGERILHIDRKFMKEHNIELITPVIILNTMGYTLHHVNDGSIDPSSTILTLTKE